MHKFEASPDLKHLVLLGGGHAQVAVLKSLMMAPVDGLRVTLISRDIITPYSGMLPGYLEGQYQAEEIGIDLSHLARCAGARFIHGNVSSLDADRRRLTITGYPEMSYDLLSINIGSSPDLTSIQGASEFAIPVKPISQLLSKLDPVLGHSTKPKHIVVIGGGAAGVEMILSLHYRLTQLEKRDVTFTLVQRGPRIMPEFPPKAADILQQDLMAKGIVTWCGHGVEAIDQDGISLDDGRRIDADHVLVVTAGRPADFLKDSGLALDDRGFIAVTSGLQSQSHNDVFAAGDIASVMASPRPKAGVFAVRAGPILTRNLRHALIGSAVGNALVSWRPQRHYLALIGTGDQKAMAVRGRLVLPPSRMLWRLKEWIDRKFIQKFSDLPDMPAPLPSPLAQAMAAEGHQGDAALASMRCLGCGAKTGYNDLDAGIAEAEAFLRHMGYDGGQSLDTKGDSVRLNLPKGQIVQSVDAISALVDDPFMLGRIAALHAMSDLFASHAQPHSALAILTLPHAFSRLQKNDITQILAGAMLALREHGADLVGGHTSAGAELQVGFAVTGIASNDDITLPKDGDALILTKPLGIGVIMAAHAQGHHLATGLIRQKAIDVMAQSNGIAAKILADAGTFPMTDVTGFGLGRHGLSLAASIGDGTSSLEIDLASLPVIAPARELIADGVASSLFEANALAAPILSAASDSGLLHDPQTGGGLMAVVSAAEASMIVQKLRSSAVDAAVIGRISFDGRAEITLT